MPRVKRRLIKIFSNRLAFVILSLFIQILFFLVPALFVVQTASFLYFSILLGFIVALLIVSRDENEAYKIAWLILILFLPIFGSVMYGICGNKKKGPWEERRIKSYKEIAHADRKFIFPNTVDTSILENPCLIRQANYIKRVAEYGLCDKTYSKLYPLVDDAYPVILDELKKAKQFIFLEFFIISHGCFWDSVLEILKEKTTKGVEVFLMYDDMGSINNLSRNYYKVLRTFGIKAIAFNKVHPRINPRLNYRDHRKIIVIDGDIAFSGGFNLADEYINKDIRFGHWRDNVIMIKGRGVANYSMMFLQLWSFVTPPEFVVKSFSKYLDKTTDYPTDGYLQSFGDSPLDDVNVAENAYLQILNNATKYVWITTPYLIIDSVMKNALILAAESGVDVRIITPAIPDKKIVFQLTRENYKPLLESGVRIFEYTPGFIHAKTFVSDDVQAIVGTTNLDYRSFYLHFECGTIFYGSSVVSQVKKEFNSTLKVSKEISIRDFNNIPIYKRIMINLLKVISPLL